MNEGAGWRLDMRTPRRVDVSHWSSNPESFCLGVTTFHPTTTTLGRRERGRAPCWSRTPTRWRPVSAGRAPAAPSAGRWAPACAPAAACHSTARRYLPKGGRRRSHQPWPIPRNKWDSLMISTSYEKRVGSFRVLHGLTDSRIFPRHVFSLFKYLIWMLGAFTIWAAAVPLVGPRARCESYELVCIPNKYGGDLHLCKWVHRLWCWSVTRWGAGQRTNTNVWTW